MKLIIVAVFVLTISYSSLPQSQGSNPVPTTARREFQLKVPKDTWEPIFFKAIDERASLSNLKSLRSGALPDGDLEVRVWHGFGLTALEGFVLKRVAGQWSSSHLDGVTDKLASPESSRKLGTPKFGWDASFRRLEEAGLFTLPDASSVSCNAGATDGMSYVVEFNRDGVYRTYMYDNPDYAKCEEAKRMIQIGNLISEDYGVLEMATK